MSNRQHIVLAVAAAWFSQPSYANTITSTWTRKHPGTNSGGKSLEESLHAKLHGQVHGHDRDLKKDKNTNPNDEGNTDNEGNRADGMETFIGPGVMECSNAVCTFEVDADLKCADPCHTHSAPRMYEYPFLTFSTVSDPYYESDELCFYRNAAEINTHSPELAVIEEGCTARCTGCTFASPIVSVSGPSMLQCNDGRCTKYVHGETFDCGRDIEVASEGYGTLSTLTDDEDIPHEFHGFEGINGSFEIPDTCKLECTGCSVPMDSGNNQFGNKSDGEIYLRGGKTRRGLEW